MKRLLNIYNKPSYVFHELTHAFVGLLLFNMIESIVVKTNRENGKLYGYTIFKSNFRNIIEEFVVSFAPLFFMIFFIILAFNYNFFIYVVFYQLSTIKYSLPSKGDIYNIKNYNLYKRFDFDTRLVNEYKISIGQKIEVLTDCDFDEELINIENNFIMLYEENENVGL